MAGPLIEAIKERLDDTDESTVRRKLEDSPLVEDHRGKLREHMQDGGGCCNAAMAARAIRRDGKEYR